MAEPNIVTTSPVALSDGIGNLLPLAIIADANGGFDVVVADVNTTASTGTAAPGTAPSKMQQVGGEYVAAGVTLTNGQSAALQLDNVGNLKTKDYWIAQAFTLIGGGSAGVAAIQIGGQYNTTPPTLTNAQGAGLQVDVNGNLKTVDKNVALSVAATGAAVPADAVQVGAAYVASPTQQTTADLYALLSNAFGALRVDDTGVVPTYSIAGAFTSAASATDVVTITGSASKTIEVLRIEFNVANNSATGYAGCVVIKRSAANTGGTSTTPTPVPHDSSDAAATATVNVYTANPSGLGTAVGSVAEQLFQGVASQPNPTTLLFDFGSQNQKPLILRGTSQVLAINLGTYANASTCSYRVVWRERT